MALPTRRHYHCPDVTTICLQTLPDIPGSGRWMKGKILLHWTPLHYNSQWVRKNGTLSPVEINEDHPNDNKQSYLFRNSYTQGGGPPSLVTDKDSNTGRGVESFSVKKKRGRLQGCCGWQLLGSWRQDTLWDCFRSIFGFLCCSWVGHEGKN